MSKKEQIAFRCSECSELFPKELVDEILKGKTVLCEKCGFPFRSQFTKKEYKKMGSPPIQAPKLKRKQTVAYSRPKQQKKSKKSPKKRITEQNKPKYRYEPPPRARIENKKSVTITHNKNEKVPEEDIRNLKSAIRIMNDIVGSPLIPIIGVLILALTTVATTIGPGSTIQTIGVYKAVMELVVNSTRFVLIMVLWSMNNKMVIKPIKQESYTNLGIDAILIGIIGIPLFGISTFYLLEGIFILLYEVFSRRNNLIDTGKTDDLSLEIFAANYIETMIKVINDFIVKGTLFVIFYSLIPILKKVRDFDISNPPIGSFVFFGIFFIVSIQFIIYLHRRFVKKIKDTAYQDLTEELIVQCTVFSSFTLVYAGVGSIGLIMCILLFVYRMLYRQIKKKLPSLKYAKPVAKSESVKTTSPSEKQVPFVPTKIESKKESTPPVTAPTDGKKPLQKIPMIHVEDKEARKQLVTSLKESEKEKPEKPPRKPPVADKGDIKEYMDRVFTVLTADIRNRLLTLDIPEDQKWDVIREFVNLKKTQQQKYLDELENVNRVLSEQLKKRVQKMKLPKKETKSIIEQLEIMDPKEQVQFVEFLEHTQ